MSEEIEQKLFEVAKGQDQIMQSLSGEMSVKTSLYLVFTAFVFSSAIQIVSFSKDVAKPCSLIAIKLSSVSAAFSLLAGIMLLIAALVRTYSIFPTRKMLEWTKAVAEYKQKYPDAKTMTPSEGVLTELIVTAENNKAVSEKSATWITVGAYLLFLAVAFLALGGGFALYALFKGLS